jgi:hypothetical protein
VCVCVCVDWWQGGYGADGWNVGRWCRFIGRGKDICRPVCLSVSLSVCLPGCLSIHEGIEGRRRRRRGRVPSSEEVGDRGGSVRKGRNRKRGGKAADVGSLLVFGSFVCLFLSLPAWITPCSCCCSFCFPGRGRPSGCFGGLFPPPPPPSLPLSLFSFFSSCLLRRA